MKYYKYRLIALIAAVATFATVAIAGAHITFVNDTSTVQMGAMEPDTVATQPVQIVNTGDSDLVITSIFSSCRCSRADYPRTAIAPGDTAVIDIWFSSHRRYPGAFIQSLQMRSNADNSPLKILLTGTITAKKTW